MIDGLGDIGNQVVAAVEGLLPTIETRLANLPAELKSNPQARIVVVGGGPAGIHFAYSLKTAG